MYLFVEYIFATQWFFVTTLPYSIIYPYFLTATSRLVRDTLYSHDFYYSGKWQMVCITKRRHRFAEMSSFLNSRIPKNKANYIVASLFFFSKPIFCKILYNFIGSTFDNVGNVF